MKKVQMKRLSVNCILLLFMLLISYTFPCLAQQTGFTQEDRERLVWLEATLISERQ